MLIITAMLILLLLIMLIITEQTGMETEHQYRGLYKSTLQELAEEHSSNYSLFLNWTRSLVKSTLSKVLSDLLISVSLENLSQRVSEA